MEYKELSKIYHMDASLERESNNRSEAVSRLEAPSTFRLGYSCPHGELFIATPRELTVLVEKILRKERLVSDGMKKMPGIVSHSMLRGLVLDEIVSSNMIEGVHSTRRQIKDALNSMDSESGARKRFKELATLYMAIIDETADCPRTPEEVRALYDKVMDGELPDADRPDGRLFRAQGVDVVDGVRVVHSGLAPENRIIEAIEAMLTMASDETLPALYGAMASHYIFEYAHPFYDGNGRTGRYLLALYLSRTLSMATSLSLSRTIAERKREYYRAFETVQNPLNHGELTHFVHQMLLLVNIAQERLLLKLDQAKKTYERIDLLARSASEALALNDRESSVMYMLMQYEAFGLFGDASLQEIARYLALGTQMTRKHLSALEKAGVVAKVNKRDPITFSLTDGFKSTYPIVVAGDAVFQD